MAYPTVPETTIRGDISTYLAANYNSRGTLFGGTKAPVSAVTIAMVTDALRFGYDGGAQTNESLRATANYLIWLTNMWGQEAQAISGQAGGGTVTPINPGGYPAPYDFIVSSSSFVSDGSPDVHIPLFIGYNVLFVRNGITQSVVPNGASYYSWDKVNGIMSFLSDDVNSPTYPESPAQVGEIFQIYPQL